MTEGKKKPYKFIAVSGDTHARLFALGRMGDTMDSIIRSLLPPEPLPHPKPYKCDRCGLGVMTLNVDMVRCNNCGSKSFVELRDPF